MPRFTRSHARRKAKLQAELDKLKAMEGDDVSAEDEDVDANEDEVDAEDEEVDANEDEVDANEDDVDAEDEEVDANDDDVDAEEEEVEARIALFQGLPEAKGQQQQAAALAREGVKLTAARRILKQSARSVRSSRRKDTPVSQGGRSGGANAETSKDVQALTALAHSAGFRKKRAS